jgi:hypothetical protein
MDVPALGGTRRVVLGLLSGGRESAEGNEARGIGQKAMLGGLCCGFSRDWPWGWDLLGPVGAHEEAFGCGLTAQHDVGRQEAGPLLL